MWEQKLVDITMWNMKFHCIQQTYNFTLINLSRIANKTCKSSAPFCAYQLCLFFVFTFLPDVVFHKDSPLASNLQHQCLACTGSWARHPHSSNNSNLPSFTTLKIPCSRKHLNSASKNVNYDSVSVSTMLGMSQGSDVSVRMQVWGSSM